MYKETIETKDLLLTKANKSHTMSLWKNFWSDEISAKYMFLNITNTLEEAKIRMQKTIDYQKDHISYIIIEKKSKEAIGIANFIEIEKGIYEDRNIALGHKYTNKGYGKQILKALLDYMFYELDAKTVIYACVKENIASNKLQQSFNFKFSHSINATRERDNKDFTINYYKLEKNDYTLNNEYTAIIDYVNNSPWSDNTDTNIIIKIAYKVFNDLTTDKTKEKVLYRLCGQTGSGKTSQLLYAIEEYTKKSLKNPVILGVRTCSKYHPNYTSLLKNTGETNIREATNGFALKCMTYVLKLLIEHEYMILLDITLLDPIYEQYLLNLLNKHNYKINYHLMSVSNQISTLFLNKRQSQTGRKVSTTSIEYFNNILEKGYEYLLNNDTKNTIYIWNAFDLNPKYVGPIKNSYHTFIKNRTLTKKLKYNEQQLKEAKLNYLLNEKEG